MKKITFLSFGLLLFLINCNKKESVGPSGPDIETVLPLIQITVNTEIQNEPKVPAMMEVYENGELTMEQTIGIEYRGSTSFRLSDKKSYGIETWDENGEDVDVSILGFPKEEDWILMGHAHRAEWDILFDPTLMRHFVGYELYRSMGNYASRCEFVEVTINDEYMGVYIFMEKLKRDNDRIDISRLDPNENDEINITGGYILKIDKTAGGDVATPASNFDENWDEDATYNEAISFRSVYGTDGSTLDFEAYRPPYHDLQYLETYFLYEYPKAQDISDKQKEYIQDYIYQFETALMNDDFASDIRTYTDYMDINSFVDYFILNELVRNIDGYRLSTYLQKDKGKKLQMGPVWDLNIGYTDIRDPMPIDEWIINYNNYVPTDAWLIPFWWGRLLEDPQFTDVLKARWTSLRSGPLATGTVTGLVRSTGDYLIQTGAADRNYERWTGIPVSYQSEIDAMADYLDYRLNWMDTEIGNL